MINKKKKVIALSVVALVLASLVVFGLTTYAWIDDVKLVEFNNDDAAQNNAPLKTGTDINAAVNITKGENTVDLGNMLTNEDITYEYTEGNETKRHIKYDIAAQEKANIDKNKGYFYESGDMHLSGCYSDGEIFCFPRYVWDESENAFVIRGYREGNKDDENVNYISFTTKVSSPDATVDFWFDSMPTIQGKNAGGSTVDVSSYARYAIIVDGECHVYSSSGTANTCNAGLTGTTAVNGVRKTSNYTYGDNTNTTADRGANSNTLFSIKKGGTVNMTVKIWLEGGVSSDVTASNINLKLVSSWKYYRTITIKDETTGPLGTSWIRKNDAKLYLVLPKFLKEKNEDPLYWWGLRTQGLPIFELTLDENKSNEYSVTLPLVYNNEEMMVYRCNDSGWCDPASDASARSDYNVNCWNWWGTYTPNTYKDETYTLYGCSLDESANYCFKFQLNNNSFPLKTELPNKGYGTWGGVDRINVYSHYAGTDYVPKYVTQNNEKKMQKLFVRDFSDYDASGEVYIYEMCRLPSSDTNQDGKIDDDDITDGDPWSTYVPKSSSRIQFSAFDSANSLFGVWGYNSWRASDSDIVGDCPQQRPLKNEFFTENATVYHIAGNDSDNTHHTYGRGYWESGGQYVYLIMSGDIAGVSPAYANLVDEHVANYYLYNNSVMSVLRDNDNTKDIKFVRGGNEFTVCKSNDGVNYQTTVNNKNIYRYVNFNNNVSQNNNWTVQSGNKRLYPGCFYHFSEQKWYGSLDDNGRTATQTSSSGGGSGTDVGGGSMSGYNTDTTFVFKINSTEYIVKTNGTNFKVRLPLSAGDNWVTVQKKEGTYPEYGNGEAGKYYDTKEGVDLYLTTANFNNFSIRAGSSGNFIVAFQNENQDTIKITSILKEGS